MTDPIKAALEAAGEAARKAIITPGCCMEGTGCEIGPCHCSQVAASAAIAAFLRALPHGGRVPDAENSEDPGWSWEAWIGRDLAAAVEQAAREDGR